MSEKFASNYLSDYFSYLLNWHVIALNKNYPVDFSRSHKSSYYCCLPTFIVYLELESSLESLVNSCSLVLSKESGQITKLIADLLKVKNLLESFECSLGFSYSFELDFLLAVSIINYY